MMRLLGGSATPMGFGEVYTALQSNIIDGAENNEMALTDNGHGDVCKYYSYDMHQMVPDILIGNDAFMGCTSLKELYIPESVVQIGPHAFDNCPNLKLICKKGSYADIYLRENNYPYTFANK